MGAALRLGLTGGIGSGKSTVAGMLAHLGAAVIDADAISRSTTAAYGPAIAPLAAEFGSSLIDASGALDRNAMRALVYADTSARKRLEAIVHPLVGLETQRQTRLASAAGNPCIVFDIPLLVESAHWRQAVNQVLVVDCTPAVQTTRVMERSGLTQAAVESIMAAQATRAARLRAADVVIFNDQLSLAQLELEVTQLWQRFGLSFP